jgi:hypothetical protein
LSLFRRFLVATVRLAVVILALFASAPVLRAQTPEVVVALLDTGIEEKHPALAGVLLPAVNVLEPGKPARDGWGHGTVMAGIIAGKSEKPELRGWAAGAAVRVLPIKVCEEDEAAASALVAGIDAAIAAKASVICIPFAAPSSTAELDAALERARKAGVLVVAAAGDASEDFGGFDAEPAAHPWVVSCTASEEGLVCLPSGKGVAAGRANGERVMAGFAATGETELMLPGAAIPIAFEGAPEILRGTSVACARAAALAAVLRASRPDLDAPRAREILVTAGGLPEAPEDQATERLRRGSRAGVLKWAAKPEGCDVFVAGVQRTSGIGFRLSIEVGNLGNVPAPGRVDVTPPGADTALSMDFKALQPGERATLSFDLGDVDFDAVALVRVVAEKDFNPENDTTRAVCFPPSKTGVEVHGLRLTRQREGSTKARVAARLRNGFASPRDLEVVAGIGESAGKKTVSLPAGGFADVELEFDVPDESDLSEAPLIFRVTEGKEQVALEAAMVDLGPATFVPQSDMPNLKREFRR